ncbi:MAG: hypothetical protein ABID09_00635 [Candidatus Omnitrophota bacterium]
MEHLHERETVSRGVSTAYSVLDWRKKHALFVKCVSIILAVVFLHQQTGWAQNGRPVWAEARPLEITQQDILTKSRIEIPYDIAKTQSVKMNGGSEVIVHIQDAHSSLSAQYSIAKLLDSLVTGYDLSFIALEGSAGDIDTSVLRTFPDKKIRKDTASFLMREGRMSAGEFFAITCETEDVSLYGIENEELYLKNLESFRKVATERARQTENLTKLIAQLSQLGEKIWSEDLKSFDKTSALHREGDISFSEHWKEVGTYADKYGIDVSEYNELSKLVESITLEKEIDFAKANTERRELIDRLSEKMSEEELEKLVMESLAFKQNKISQGAYHGYLTMLAEEKGISASGYENLIKFTRYVTIYESVELVELYRQMELMEEGIRDKLYRNDDERELYHLIRMARLLKQLYSMELISREYAYLKDNYRAFTAEKYADFIRENANKYGAVISGGYDLSEITKGVDEAMSFYSDAEARDNALLANTINKMRAEGKQVAALITGGYHTKGMTDLMSQKGLSYLVVVPKFENGKERPYVAILTNKKKEYEKILETGKYQLAVQGYFDQYNGDLSRIKSVFSTHWVRPRLAVKMSIWLRPDGSRHTGMSEKQHLKKKSIVLVISCTE